MIDALKEFKKLKEHASGDKQICTYEGVAINMKKWVVILAIVMIVISVCLYVFRTQPLIADGYVIQDSSSSLIIDDPTKVINLNPGRVHINYNPDFPEDSSILHLSIDADELETILKTAKCRLSLNSMKPFFARDVQYQILVTLIKDGTVRHLQLYLGTNSWNSGGSFDYTIQNGDELIAALNSAKSIERIY